MEVDGTIIWNVVLTLIIMPFAWAFNKMFAEVKRLQILLNKTREEYASKEDLRDTSARVMDTLHRLEDKLDKVLTNGSR
jgi:membrane protein insertase Oxa1/YidC/SpoIIIJ